MTDASPPLSYDLPMVCRTRGDQDLAELARANGLSETAAEAVAAIDAVMHKVRRSIQRRDFGRQMLERMGSDLDIAHLDAIGAIAHNPVGNDQPAEEVTVGLIAERLGIDPSRASRVSADIVERGYARRVASQTDARRICLELTPRGLRFVEAVRVSKWDLLSHALGKWDEKDLVTFAALLERFSNWTTDNDAISTSVEAAKRILAEPE
ncbi:MAG: winged helix-turn-helix transcriptional regulator [Devosia sp.]|nr:winged helix-turn-helix transcriptional regulator [Devosia sp.]